MNAIRSAATTIRQVVARLEAEVILAINRWIARLHYPVDVGTSTPICWLDHRPWPCDEFVLAAERISRYEPKETGQ